METALIVTWKHPYPTREKQALDYSAEVQAYWNKQADSGKCTAPEIFFLPTGEGIWMVKGKRTVLEELAWGDEAQRLLTKGELLLQEFAYAFARTGEDAQKYLQQYAGAANDLGMF